MAWTSCTYAHIPGNDYIKYLYLLLSVPNEVFKQPQVESQNVMPKFSAWLFYFIVFIPADGKETVPYSLFNCFCLNLTVSFLWLPVYTMRRQIVLVLIPLTFFSISNISYHSGNDHQAGDTSFWSSASSFEQETQMKHMANNLDFTWSSISSCSLSRRRSFLNHSNQRNWLLAKKFLVLPIPVSGNWIKTMSWFNCLLLICGYDRRVIEEERVDEVTWRLKFETLDETSIWWKWFFPVFDGKL